MRFLFAISFSAVIFLGALAAPAAGQTPACDRLAADAKGVATAVFAKQYPYDGCDQTFVRCLSAEAPHPLVVRLADYICRLAGEGQDEAAITRALERRAMTMMRPGKVHRIDLTGNPALGSSGAKVTLAVYLCGTCPFCAKIIPVLAKEVTSGRLAGKVAVYLRLFPIRGHDGANESAFATAAAGKLGRYWDYLLHVYENFAALKVDVLADWAVALGLDRDAFTAAYGSPEIRAAVVESKKEGLRNEVAATPTFFLNGRRFVADMDLLTLIDILEEEYNATP